MPTAVSANRLDNGTVTYLGSDGVWVGSLEAAKLFATAAEATKALEDAQGGPNPTLVIDPFLAEIEETEAGRRPVHLRDAIRAAGPTVKAGPTVTYAASAKAARS